MSNRVRKLLKLSLTLVLLGIVVPRVDWHAFAAAFGALSLLELGALAVLVVLQQALLTRRFATVLTSLGAADSVGHAIRFCDLLIDQQVGTAYNVVLPSTVGGDVVRGLRVQRRMSGAVNARHAVSWSAILLDRLVGLLALVLVPLAGLLFAVGPASSVLLRTAAAVSLLLLPLVLFAGRLFLLLARLAQGRSARLSQLARDVGGVLERATWATRWAALAWSLLYLLLVNAFFHIACAAFGIPLARAFPAIWVGLPLAFVLSMLPITIGGIGLRESLFVGILGLYGLTPAQALALSLLWSAQGLLTAGVGVIALWCEKAPSSAAPAA